MYLHYVHILHLYVRYDYVQRCEDTVSVELRYINYIVIIVIIIIIIIQKENVEHVA